MRKVLSLARAQGIFASSSGTTSNGILMRTQPSPIVLLQQSIGYAAVVGSQTLSLAKQQEYLMILGQYRNAPKKARIVKLTYIYRLSNHGSSPVIGLGSRCLSWLPRRYLSTQPSFAPNALNRTSEVLKYSPEIIKSTIQTKLFFASALPPQVASKLNSALVGCLYSEAFSVSTN